MFRHRYLLHDVSKIEAVIRSNKNHAHVRTTANMINNFEALHLSKNNSPKILINSYVDYLKLQLRKRWISILRHG